MKKALLITSLFILLFSCKKYVQQQEENAIVSIMTSGVWYVQTYDQNDSNITGTFTGYTFQFKSNGTVLAIKDSMTIATGTWVGNINTETINSSFPGAADPLDKLNSLWKITDSGLDYVVANTIIGVNQDSLYLEKE